MENMKHHKSFKEKNNPDGRDIQDGKMGGLEDGEVRAAGKIGG